MEESPFLRPILGRQLSTPLPSPSKESQVSRQTSVPTPSLGPRQASEEFQGFTTLDESNADAGVSGPRRTALMRMRGFASVRNNRTPVAGAFDARGVQGTRPSDSNSNLEEPNLFGEEIKQVMDRAIRYFNLNPKVALKYLKEKRVTYTKGDPPEVNARRIALFLKNTRGLNKVKIGELLGKDEQILREYLGTFDFARYEATILGIEKALREVLSHFKPIGESQVFSRIAECFAERFSDHSNPHLTKDDVSFVTWLIIMVNVALHNPNSKKDGPFRTKDQVVTTFAKEDTLQGKVTKEEASTLYDNILKSEIKHEPNREDLAGNLFAEPDMSGWLEIKFFPSSSLFPRLRTRWLRRYAILSQNVLYYFQKCTDVEFEGFIPLENLRLFTENPNQIPGLTRKHFSSPSHNSSSLLTSQSAQNLRETESAPPIPVEVGSVSVPQSNRLARLISCPGFRTSQSSLNSSANTTTTPSVKSRRSWFSLPSSSKRNLGPYSTFALAPKDASLMKSARLNKVRRKKKKRTGELIPQHLIYIAFRTRARDEFDRWVTVLRQEGGLVRGRAAVSFFSSISARNKYWSTSSKSRLLSPQYSLPTTFSADIEREDEDTEEAEGENLNVDGASVDHRTTTLLLDPKQHETIPIQNQALVLA